MIVEVSATPGNGANLLIEILDRELNAVEMIKLDLHVRNKSGGDWRGTLVESVEHREALGAGSGSYIRPIGVIQVERISRQKRKPGYVRNEDVLDFLLQYPGIAPEHIALKTGSTDELEEVDDAWDSLSCDYSIRFIITEQALHEGWDFPVAYILKILTNPMSKTGIPSLSAGSCVSPAGSR